MWRDNDTKSKVIIDLWFIFRTKNSQLFQRSRSKWFKIGDTNLGYFHAFVKRMRRRNINIVHKVGEVLIKRVYYIRREVVNHFTEIFKEPNVNRCRLDCVVFHSLLDKCNISLSAHFRLEELNYVVTQCDGKKFPHSDGFKSSFF